MKRLILLFFFGLGLSANAQLVFEVQQPSNESGIYPCMAGKPAEWTSSPNLYQNGNWYNDTLIVSNDGTTGSACNPLSNSLTGNFGICYRTGCDLTQLLENMQNAGATGAIIVDSVSGRPLPFDMNSVNSSVTIPFVVISKDKGDSLINEINAGNDVVVAFGDKTGISTSDIGIYKEYALWSRWGTYPIGYLYLPDERFGAWVFNHGTTDQTNLALELWFSVASNSANDTTFTSPSFSLNAGDSVFIDFNFPFEHDVQNVSTSVDTMNYGYNIIGATDNDTLDNAISNYVLGNGEMLSQSYISSEDLSQVDYFLSLNDSSFQTYHYFLNDRGNITGLSHQPECLVDPKILFVSQGPSTNQFVEVEVGISEELSNWNGNTIPMLETFIGIANADLTPPNDTTFFSLLGFLGPYGQPMSATFINVMGKVNIGYVSDMYFDEIYRQTGIANYFHHTQFNQSQVHVETYLTPVFFSGVEPTGTSFCYESVQEIDKQATVEVFPNPNETEFITLKSDQQMTHVTIRDIHGKQIKTANTKGTTEYQLSMPDLNTGYYMLEISFENDQVLYKKILKM